MLAKGIPHWLPLVYLTPLVSLPLFWDGRYVLGYVLALFTTILSIFLTFFFRDPDREVGKGIVSPADGRILKSEQHGRIIFISIFMSPFDVHVNRAPLTGKIKEIKRKDGGHKPAFSKDSDLNERVIWKIESELGEMELIQIAGSFARRIVIYKKKGDKIRKGERIGMIKFGSRVDMKLSCGDNLRVVVKAGDRVFASKSTVIEEEIR